MTRSAKIFSRGAVVALALSVALLVHCPRNEEDAMMLHIYHSLHDEIERATLGTAISPAYMAAIITLESSPPGNRDSRRFEPRIYERLRQARAGIRPYGRMGPGLLGGLSDSQLKELSTSHGLTQIMGYHCLDLGCDVRDLMSEHHLQWSVVYMARRYQKYARKGDWEACFRIHNTGRPNGKTYRPDYVERGLKRMAYYQSWVERKGRIF